MEKEKNLSPENFERKENGLEISFEEKKKVYQEILKNSEAIFVLDCDIREVKIHDRIDYRSTSFISLDAHGFLGGGHSRVIAAAELAKFFPETKIVTTSRYQPDKPIHAEIYAKELKNLGVPEKQIELEPNSTSTMASLVELVKMTKMKNWKAIAILTNEYHLPRVKEMYRQLEILAEKFNLSDKDFKEAEKYFKSHPLETNFVAAEDILPLRDKRYKKIIENVKQTEEYKKRIESEARGTQQLIEGTYGKK